MVTAGREFTAGNTLRVEISLRGEGPLHGELTSNLTLNTEFKRISANANLFGRLNFNVIVLS